MNFQGHSELEVRAHVEIATCLRDRIFALNFINKVQFVKTGGIEVDNAF